MSIKEDLKNKLLHGHNPYANFPVREWAIGWYNDPGACQPIFERAIEAAQARLVVEVGSFVGESAIHMAGLLRKRNPDSAIVCVDTWMGGLDHWTQVPEKLKFWFGRPSLYYQFIANVLERRCEDLIVPLSLDSINAARLLKILGVVPDMVYVDASHEEGDAFRDYEAYWDLLRPGGVMLVDDVSRFFPAVVKDWEKFVKKKKLMPVAEAEKGMLVKP